MMEAAVVSELFAEVSKTFRLKGTLTNDILSALQFIFQGPLLPALDLIDRHKLTVLLSPSGRKAYQVLGSTGVPYVCPGSADYCSCAAFKFSVLKKGEQMMCKHLLAIRLGEAMDKMKQYQVSDEELCDTLKQID